MSIVRTLRLHNFRNYDGAVFADLPAGLIILHGPNGAGKTNILEAISLLTPGRGLRGAAVPALQNTASDRIAGPWAIAGEIDGPFGTARLGTGGDDTGDRRVVRINGETVRGQAALAEYFSALWLTPQMDRLFIEAAGPRRRFFDRLVYSFDAGHAARVTRYENAMAQRSRLLKADRATDPLWLGTLEIAMAENGVAIAAARRDFVRRLVAAVAAAGEEQNFPRAALRIDGFLETGLDQSPAVELEASFRDALRRDRPLDAVRGGAGIGPHRSDFSATYLAKNRPAAECSTGEQKALLIGIVLAQARLIAAAQGMPPLLLLDEVVAHLDEARRRALFGILRDLGGQVWMTGTDAGLFADPVAKFRVENGAVTPDGFLPETE